MISKMGIIKDLSKHGIALGILGALALGGQTAGAITLNDCILRVLQESGNDEFTEKQCGSVKTKESMKLVLKRANCFYRAQRDGTSDEFADKLCGGIKTDDDVKLALKRSDCHFNVRYSSGGSNEFAEGQCGGITTDRDVKLALKRADCAWRIYYAGGSHKFAEKHCSKVQ